MRYRKRRPPSGAQVSRYGEGLVIRPLLINYPAKVVTDELCAVFTSAQWTSLCEVIGQVEKLYYVLILPFDLTVILPQGVSYDCE